MIRGLPGLTRNLISISIGPRAPRLLTSLKPRLPPSFDNAVRTFVFMASRRNPKTENSVDFPVPFAPTSIASRGIPRMCTFLNARKFFIRICSICTCGYPNSPEHGPDH